MRRYLAVLALILLASPGRAQEIGSRGSDAAEPLELSLRQAIELGLENGLSVALSSARVLTAEGDHREDHWKWLPQLDLEARQSSRQVNLRVAGFSTFPGIPDVVGPFGVVDGRLRFDWSLVDLEAWRGDRASGLAVDAERFDHEIERARAAFVIIDLYLSTLAGEARLETVGAELDTARSLHALAESRKRSGLVAGIEVLRAAVAEQDVELRRIRAGRDLAEARLGLARALGLAPRQRFELTSRVADEPAPELTLERAVSLALEHRRDLKAARARVEAARAALRSERSSRVPKLALAGNYGVLGGEIDEVEETFDLGIGLRMPLVDSENMGERVRAQADLYRAQAVLDDLEIGVPYEIELAMQDLSAAQQAVEVARESRRLGALQLEQASNRFAAGVAGNLEVVEAQESAARLAESWIRSLYLFNLSKARLALLLGGGAGGLEPFLAGTLE